MIALNSYLGTCLDNGLKAAVRAQATQCAYWVLLLKNYLEGHSHGYFLFSVSSTSILRVIRHNDSVRTLIHASEWYLLVT